MKTGERGFSVKKLSLLGLLLAFALILSYIESLVPFFMGVPGMKLGLPNMAIVLLIYLFGEKEGLLVNALRIAVSGLLFGSMFGILFSLSGTIVSFIAMVILKKARFFDICGVSVIGGIAHNIAQMLVAAYIVKTSGIIYYLPALLIMGTITGYLNGFIASHMMPLVKRFILT
jgi:heptaprenyl diphosphate synthase